MTKRRKQTDITLPFDPADLVSARVPQVRYAELMEVTRGTVSRWVKEGKIVAGPDGLIDPVQATRQLIANTDPARMRARVLKNATMEHSALRERVEGLEQALQEERDSVAPRMLAARYGERDDHARKLHLFLNDLEARWIEAQQAHDAGTLEQWLDDVSGAIFYGDDDDG